eukprot:TRINITY_DN3089_c0_g1_i1.p2 TRINITY_DN3089_c0_g1~~TRINITY_DN3089_c0_g1_i1.p2  ORF type:complete len:613 (+),score=157.41 TRINITY_DN3089_c0_g1_i1:37-1839(+)
MHSFTKYFIFVICLIQLTFSKEYLKEQFQYSSIDRIGFFSNDRYFFLVNNRSIVVADEVGIEASFMIPTPFNIQKGYSIDNDIIFISESLNNTLLQIYSPIMKRKLTSSTFEGKGKVCVTKNKRERLIIYANGKNIDIHTLNGDKLHESTIDFEINDVVCQDNFTFIASSRSKFIALQYDGKKIEKKGEANCNNISIAFGNFICNDVFSRYVSYSHELQSLIFEVYEDIASENYISRDAIARCSSDNHTLSCVTRNNELLCLDVTENDVQINGHVIMTRFNQTLETVESIEVVKNNEDSESEYSIVSHKFNWTKPLKSKPSQIAFIRESISAKRHVKINDKTLFTYVNPYVIVIVSDHAQGLNVTILDGKKGYTLKVKLLVGYSKASLVKLIDNHIIIGCQIRSTPCLSVISMFTVKPTFEQGKFVSRRVRLELEIKNNRLSSGIKDFAITYSNQGIQLPYLYILTKNSLIHRFDPQTWLDTLIIPKKSGFNPFKKVVPINNQNSKLTFNNENRLSIPKTTLLTNSFNKIKLSPGEFESENIIRLFGLENVYSLEFIDSPSGNFDKGNSENISLLVAIIIGFLGIGVFFKIQTNKIKYEE